MSSLPRTTENSGLIDLRLKRKIEYKKVVRQEYQSKKELEEALEYLIKNHPSYSSMKKIALPEPDESAEESSSIIDDTEVLQPNDCDDDMFEDNPFLQTTTLIPENPESKKY